MLGPLGIQIECNEVWGFIGKKEEKRTYAFRITDRIERSERN